MASKGNQDTLTGLDKLIADAQARLAANPDYVAIIALQKARAEIVGIKGSPATPATLFTLDEHLATIQPDVETRPLPKKISQLAAAEAALERIGHPLSAEDLMDEAIKDGAVVGGAKPVISFGSSLSKSPHFKSVRWLGDYAWWFSDRPVPSTRLRVAAE